MFINAVSGGGCYVATPSACLACESPLLPTLRSPTLLKPVWRLGPRRHGLHPLEEKKASLHLSHPFLHTQSMCRNMEDKYFDFFGLPRQLRNMLYVELTCDLASRKKR